MNIGDRLGSFTISARLGSGGMGEVFLADQPNIDTKVAIKVLRSEISKDQEHVSRFFNEARAVGRIKHAGIVKIFEGGFHPSGNAYLIMEFLEGETLSSRIKRAGRLAVGTVCDLGRQIASILAATHAVGITHRDLKPDNIFIVADAELASGERVKILDFGIAKLTGTMASGPRTVGTMGTPSYMAPEQWGDSANVDWRADAYSLGCVLFEMACGRPPFLGSSFADLCAKHLTQAPPTPGSLGIRLPPALESIVMRLLSKDATQRARGLGDVGRELEAIGKTAPAALSPTVPPPFAETPVEVAPTLHPDAPEPAPAFTPHVPPPASSPEITPPQSAGRMTPAAGTPFLQPASSPEITPPPEAAEKAPSTTMRGAAGEVHEPGRKRGPVIAIASVLVVGGGIGLAMKMRGGTQSNQNDPIDSLPPPAEVDAVTPIAQPTATDAAIPVDASRSFTKILGLENPWVTKAGVTMLRHQVTYDELDLFLSSLHVDARLGAEPLLKVANHKGTDAVGGLSHDRARRFCDAIGARLPTVAEWNAVANNKSGFWAINGGDGDGSLREWTSHVDNGLATVLGDYAAMGASALIKSNREPLQVQTEAAAGASNPNVIADVHTGFRCVK